jgi:hypothetical protein
MNENTPSAQDIAFSLSYSAYDFFFFFVFEKYFYVVGKMAMEIIKIIIIVIDLPVL